MSTILLLLQMAAALLASVRQNPNMPASTQRQAIDMSVQAVELAQTSIRSNNFIGESATADDTLDVVWKKTFHWTTFFDSLSGFITGGDVLHEPSQITLHSNADNKTSHVLKQEIWQGLATFGQRSYFRTTISVDTSGVRSYVVAGNALEGNDGRYYGFKTINGTLYGVASENGRIGESAVVLGSLESEKAYNIEARYYPGNRVEFYVDPTSENQTPKGTLTNGLPSVANVPNMNLMNVVLESTDTQSKRLQISYFEYLQKRDVLR